MAKYYLDSKHISRAKGSHITYAAAYRAGERIRDERSGDTFNHSKRTDVVHKEIFLPSDLATRPDMLWAYDRSQLWNRVEQSAPKENSILGRELYVALPAELTGEQRRDLARRFARELADRFKAAVDLCIHLPRPTNDERHHHAHILMTHRVVGPQGLGQRTDLELSGAHRYKLGIAGTSWGDYHQVRERWAQLTNEALADAGLTVRIDHRSNAEQGINQEPAPRLPPKVRYAEQKSGVPTAAGNAIRAAHRERVEARLKGPEELERVVRRQKEEARQRMIERAKQRAAEPKKVPWGALTRKQRREVRHERHLARREIQKQDPAGEARRREAAREASRRWRKTHPAAATEAVMRWRQANPDKYGDYKRKYQEKNAARLAQKERAWRLANPEESKRRLREHYNRKRAAERPPLGLSGPSPEESARRWKEYDATHGPAATAEESVRRWLAFRERNGLEVPRSAGRVDEHDQKRRSRSLDEELDSKPPEQDHDLGM